MQPQSVLNLSIPEAAAYMESELGRIIEDHGLDLYRHDFQRARGEGSVTRRDGFLESDHWRHSRRATPILERTQHPANIRV